MATKAAAPATTLNAVPDPTGGFLDFHHRRPTSPTITLIRDGERDLDAFMPRRAGEAGVGPLLKAMHRSGSVPADVPPSA